MQINDIPAEYLELVISAAVVVLPTLALLVAVALGGEAAVRAVRRLARSARPAVDEPGDALVQWLADKMSMSPDEVSVYLLKLLDGFINPKTDDAGG